MLEHVDSRVCLSVDVHIPCGRVVCVSTHAHIGVEPLRSHGLAQSIHLFYRHKLFEKKK